MGGNAISFTLRRGELAPSKARVTRVEYGGTVLFEDDSCKSDLIKVVKFCLAAQTLGRGDLDNEVAQDFIGLRKNGRTNSPTRGVFQKLNEWITVHPTKRRVEIKKTFPSVECVWDGDPDPAVQNILQQLSPPKPEISSPTISVQKIEATLRESSGFDDFTETLSAFALQAAEADSIEILMCEGDTYPPEDNANQWLLRLMPTLIHLRRSGKPVRILTEVPKPLSDKADDRRKRVRMLYLQQISIAVRLGCDLRLSKCMTDTNIRYFGCLLHETHALMAIKARSLHGMFAVRYGEDASVARNAIRAYFASEWDNAEKTKERFEGFVPTISSMGHEEFLRRARRVVQYKPPTVGLQVSSIDLAKVSFINPALLAFKLLQSRYICELYDSNKIEHYQPLLLTLGGGNTSVIAPPLVEERDGFFVVLNGSHRLYWSLSQRATHIIATVASNVADALPDQPKGIGDVEVHSNQTAKGRARSPHFKRELFRRYESAVHAPAEVMLDEFAQLVKNCSETSK